MFRLYSLYKMWKEGTSDPKGFAKGQVLDAILGALIVPVVALILFLAFLFILSYTHLLGGPYGVAKFFFWLLAIFYTLAGLLIHAIYKAFKGAITRVSGSRETKSAKMESGIRDAEVVRED